MPSGRPAEARGDMGNGGHLALVGGTIYRSPDDSPLPDGTVLVQNGTIVAVIGISRILLPAGSHDGIPTLARAGI